MLSARQKDGSFRRHEMTVKNSPAVETEEKVEKPKAIDNAAFIKAYVEKGTSGNKHFDLRVKLTCEGLNQALEWLGQ